MKHRKGLCYGNNVEIKEADVIGASGQERNPAGSALISTSIKNLQNIIKNVNKEDRHLLKDAHSTILDLLSNK